MTGRVKQETVQGDWASWANHVLSELERLNTNMEKLRDEQTTTRVEIAALKVKSGVWGALGGVCTVVVMLGVFFIKTLLTPSEQLGQRLLNNYQNPNKPVQTIPANPGLTKTPSKNSSPSFGDIKDGS